MVFKNTKNNFLFVEQDMETFEMGGKHDAGKGDKYRPVNWEQYSKNWDDIFNKKKKKSAKKIDSKQK